MVDWSAQLLVAYMNVMIWRQYCCWIYAAMHCLAAQTQLSNKNLWDTSYWSTKRQINQQRSHSFLCCSQCLPLYCSLQTILKQLFCFYRYGKRPNSQFPIPQLTCQWDNSGTSNSQDEHYLSYMEFVLNAAWWHWFVWSKIVSVSIFDKDKTLLVNMNMLIKVIVEFVFIDEVLYSL